MKAKKPHARWREEVAKKVEAEKQGDRFNFNEDEDALPFKRVRDEFLGEAIREAVDAMRLETDATRHLYKAKDAIDKAIIAAKLWIKERDDLEGGG